MRLSRQRVAGFIGVFMGVGALSLTLAGAGRKECAKTPEGEHFGTSVPDPGFHSFGEFFRELPTFVGIRAGRFQGRKADLSWMTPAFREKLWLRPISPTASTTPSGSPWNCPRPIPLPPIPAIRSGNENHPSG
jgi:hypothetical protein